MKPKTELIHLDIDQIRLFIDNCWWRGGNIMIRNYRTNSQLTIENGTYNLKVNGKYVLPRNINDDEIKRITKIALGLINKYERFEYNNKLYQTDLDNLWSVEQL